MDIWEEVCDYQFFKNFHPGLLIIGEKQPGYNYLHLLLKKSGKLFYIAELTYYGQIFNSCSKWHKLLFCSSNVLHSDKFPEFFSVYYCQLTSLFISTVVGAENPPLPVLRKFAYLLDQSDLDFQEELEVTRLREEVVTKIRSNQQLEKDLNLMDIKIGLLVKNRITLQVSRLCSGSFGIPAACTDHFCVFEELGIKELEDT